MRTDFVDTYLRIPLRFLKRRINHLQEMKQRLFVSMHICKACCLSSRPYIRNGTSSGYSWSSAILLRTVRIRLLISWMHGSSLAPQLQNLNCLQPKQKLLHPQKYQQI